MGVFVFVEKGLGVKGSVEWPDLMPAGAAQAVAGVPVERISAFSEFMKDLITCRKEQVFTDRNSKTHAFQAVAQRACEPDVARASCPGERDGLAGPRAVVIYRPPIYKRPRVFRKLIGGLIRGHEDDIV